MYVAILGCYGLVIFYVYMYSIDQTRSEGGYLSVCRGIDPSRFTIWVKIRYDTGSRIQFSVNVTALRCKVAFDIKMLGMQTFACNRAQTILLAFTRGREST